MDRQEIKNVVKEAVHEELESCGFTVNDHTSVQQDMAYLRNMRLGSEAVKANIVRIVLTVTVPAILYSLWSAFKLSGGN